MSSLTASQIELLRSIRKARPGLLVRSLMDRSEIKDTNQLIKIGLINKATTDDKQKSVGYGLTKAGEDALRATNEATMDKQDKKTEQDKKKKLLVQAKELGASAFEAGIGRAPALDSKVKDLLKRAAYGVSKESSEILNAWLKGWDKANMAKPVPGMEQDSLRSMRGLAGLTENGDVQVEVSGVGRVVRSLERLHERMLPAGTTRQWKSGTYMKTHSGTWERVKKGTADVTRAHLPSDRLGHKRASSKEIEVVPSGNIYAGKKRLSKAKVQDVRAYHKTLSTVLKKAHGKTVGGDQWDVTRIKVPAAHLGMDGKKPVEIEVMPNNKIYAGPKKLSGKQVKELKRIHKNLSALLQKAK